jgi:hypothetical protein
VDLVAYNNLSEGEQRLLAEFQRAAAQRSPGAHRLPPRQGGHPRSPRPRRSPGLRPGSIAAVISEIEGCGQEPSIERAMRWGSELFTPNDVRAWLRNGLTTDDLPQIVELRALGVPPEAMTWQVNKETILDRIRIRRYSAQTVALTLQRAGLLPRKAA